MTAKEQGGLIASFLKTKLGSSLSGATIDVAAGNSPYIDAVIKAAQAGLQGTGAKIGGTERFAFGIPSFTAQAGNIARDKPAAVILLAPANDAITVSTALTQAGVASLQVGFNSSAAQAVFAKLRNPNYYAPTEVSFPENNDALLAVADKYGRKADVVGSTFSMQGWTEAAMLVQALTQCGEGCTASKLTSALNGIQNFQVPLNVSYGLVSFSPTDHVSAHVARFHAWDASSQKAVDLDPINLN
jgi:hypothetical protein